MITTTSCDTTTSKLYKVYLPIIVFFIILSTPSLCCFKSGMNGGDFVELNPYVVQAQYKQFTINY